MLHLKKIALTALAMSLLGTHAQTEPAPSRVNAEIDWPTFLARHDLVWEVLPDRFDHGAFAGNGLLGTTIYQGGPSTMVFSLGRADVTERRRDNTRLLVGALHLNLAGEIKQGSLRTVLHDAEIRGSVETDKGTVSFRALIHAKQPLVMIETTTQGTEAASWSFAAPASIYSNPRYIIAGDPPHPAPTSGSDNEIHWHEQIRASGGSYTVAWSVQDPNPSAAGQSQRVLATIADNFPEGNSKQLALETLDQAPNFSTEALVKTHREWWHAYYPASFLSVPDAQIEGFYWIQMYKYGSAIRADGPVMDLQGPWNRETRWARIWFNLNIQIAYYPIYAANRMEMGESFLNFIDRNRDNFKKNAKELYGIDDGASTGHTVCYDGRIGDGIAPKRWDRYTNPGDFIWVLHLYHMHYRFSMEHQLVTDREQHTYFDLLKGAVRCYKDLFITAEDGTLHLPVQHSPEYGSAADNNYNLSNLRWACATLLELNRRYQLNDPQAPEWEHILENLAPYPTDENGFMVGADVPFAKSHRHWAHFQMIWPLNLLSLEQPENKEVIEKTLTHWLNVQGGRGIFGWSHAAASHFYSMMGEGDNALKHLRAHHNGGRFVQPNTQYIEGSPVYECSLIAASALQYMLLKSRGDTIGIFPAMPAEWEEAVFHNLRTEGAFLVSAGRRDGKTRWVRIQSLAGEPCRIQPGFDGSFTASNPAIPMKEVEPGIFELKLAQGQEVVLFMNSEDSRPTVTACPMAPEDANFWGVKKQK